ncbi:MAG TPA: MFS transporter [Candidatus Limnocylindrales bacterium]|nr:MFS transporter [Candidatus Limnocylindrales bacterium]
MTAAEPASPESSSPSPVAGPRPWLTKGVTGIGLASLLADVGHEVPTSLLASFMSTVLGAPAVVLGVIEGLSDAVSGFAKLAGGALADDPNRRRRVALGGYVATALLSSSVGLATTAWQVGVLRAFAWAARGIRGPARNALLADAVEPAAFGRAYGFERALDNTGAVVGPLLAIVLVAAVGIRGAILLSVIPGLLAAAAIAYAINNLRTETPREHRPIRLVIRPLLRGRLGRLLAAVTVFELANVATSLLILRATDLFVPSMGADRAAITGIALYVAYNVAATLASFPAGRAVDSVGGPRVLAVGIALFAAAYALLAATGPDLVPLGLAFVAAGVGIGAVETAENATVAAAAPEHQRGSAFGLLAVIQAGGDLVASAAVGLVWTLVAPSAAFGLAAAAMLVALVALVAGSRGIRQPRDAADPS